MINIYLDVDGVLLTDEHKPSNYSNEFLQYVITNYPTNTHWLTTRCKGNKDAVMGAIGHLFEPETQVLIDKIIPTNWGTSKTEAINLDEPFLWFDDNLFSFEQRILDANNLLDNWIEVNLKKDPNQLLSFIHSFPLPLE